MLDLSEVFLLFSLLPDQVCSATMFSVRYL